MIFDCIIEDLVLRFLQTFIHSLVKTLQEVENTIKAPADKTSRVQIVQVLQLQKLIWRILVSLEMPAECW